MFRLTAGIAVDDQWLGGDFEYLVDVGEPTPNIEGFDVGHPADRGVRQRTRPERIVLNGFPIAIETYAFGKQCRNGTVRFNYAQTTLRLKQAA
ncbi:hypothetical protein GCM10027419_10180 [Pandoraea terrae]